MIKLTDIVPQKLSKISDQELFRVWEALSYLIRNPKANKEEIVNRGIFVLNELALRKLEVEKGILSDEIEKFRKQTESDKYTQVYSSGEDSDGKEIKLDEIKKFYTKPIKLLNDAVSLTGGVVIHGKSKNDFETLIRIPPRDEIVRRIIFRLDRAIPDRDLRARQHPLDDFFGPFTDSLPLYDLVLVPSEAQELKMSEALRIKEQEIRAKSPKAEAQAKKAKRTGKITLGEFFYPLKSSILSLMGYRKGEKYSVESMVGYLKKLGEKQGKDIASCFIQKKYD